MKALFVLGSIASLGVCAGAAMAGASYTGNYPVTVTRSNHSDGTYCLKLIDDGGTGRRHSGSAVLTGGPAGRPAALRFLPGDQRHHRGERRAAAGRR